MSKRSVTHTCGHEELHYFIRLNAAARDRKIDWLETTICSDCYRSQRAAGHAAEAEVAAEQNQVLGLSTLTGSDKQIAWAESIRSPICAALESCEKDFEPNPELTPAAQEEQSDAIALLVDEVRGQTSAHWWIESGRGLYLSDRGSVLNYLASQIGDRSLTPLAAAEFEVIEARERTEAEAAKRKMSELVALLDSQFSSERLTFDPATNQVVGEIAGHAVVLSSAGGIYAAVSIDGLDTRDRGPLQDKLLAFRSHAEAVLRAARNAERCASLVGLSIASVSKKQQSLTVTLSDGREILGKSSREGWELFYPDHPEVTRLTAEARAWAKKNGVK